MAETDWIVFRFSEDMPDEYRPSWLDGMWQDRSRVPEVETFDEAAQRADDIAGPGGELVAEAVAYPTGRFETRTVENTEPFRFDGYGNIEGVEQFEEEIAEVWEIRLRRATDGR